MKKHRFSLLTDTRAMVPYEQKTRQASILRDTLNSGGFLFVRVRRALP